MFKYLWYAVAALLFWACSPAERDLYKYASSESMLVATADPATAIQNLGCSIDKDGIAVSPKLRQVLNMLMRKEVADKAVEAMRIKGLALDEALIVTNGEGEMLIGMRLTDKPAFVQWLESVADSYDVSLDASTDGDWQIYALNSRQWLAIGAAEALWLSSGRGGMSATEVIAHFADQAAKSPLLPWQMETLDKGNLANAVINLTKMDERCKDQLGQSLFPSTQLALGYDPQALLSGYCTISSDLDALSWNSQYRLVDAEGKDLPYNYADDKVDVSMLKYASASDYAVSLFTVPANTDSSISLGAMRKVIGSVWSIWLDKSQEDLLGQLLSAVDGTAMIAAAPMRLNNLGSLSGWDLAIALQMPSAKADSCLQAIKEICQSHNVPCSETQGMLKAQTSEYGEIQIRTDANALVISNYDINIGRSYEGDAAPFKGQCGAFVLDIPKDNIASPLFPLPFGINIAVKFDGKTTSSQLKLVQTQGRLLENLLEIF